MSAATLNDSDREVFAGWWWLVLAGAGWCWLGRVNVSNGFNNPHKKSPTGSATPATASHSPTPSCSRGKNCARCEARDQTVTLPQISNPSQLAVSYFYLNIIGIYFTLFCFP